MWALASLHPIGCALCYAVPSHRMFVFVKEGGGKVARVYRQPHSSVLVSRDAASHATDPAHPCQSACCGNRPDSSNKNPRAGAPARIAL